MSVAKATRSALLTLLALTLAAGCKKDPVPCPDHAECREAVNCFCDGDGRLAKVERLNMHDDVSMRLTFFYDSAGRRTRVERSAGKEPDPQAIYSMEYDEQGRLAAFSTDRDADGQPERTDEAVRDERGRIVEILRSEPPSAEGVVVRRCEYTEDGQTVYESHRDGVLATRIEWVYGSDHFLQKIVRTTKHGTQSFAPSDRDQAKRSRFKSWRAKGLPNCRLTDFVK